MASTLHDLTNQSIKHLQGKVDDAYTDAQTLICHCLQVNRAWLVAHADTVLDGAASKQINAAIQRRAGGEPVAYITGFREFWSLCFRVTADVLIPRPETEHLIEQVLALDLPGKDATDEAIRVLDFGTGSGAIAVSLAKERPAWHITAMDNSAAALAIARENALGCGTANITFVNGCKLSDTISDSDHDPGNSRGNERYTIIVSNPPYIATADPHLQQGDVRFEPPGALVSGADGLDCIRMLVETAPDHLHDAGHLIMEHGYQQGAQVRQLLADNNYTAIQTIRDLSGNERITMAVRGQA